MLTEAASTGKPVFILPMQGKAGKFAHLYQSLSERCHVKPFNGKLDANTYEPLDETRHAALQLWAHYDVRNAAIN